jgi:hypothetical protein
VKVGAAGGCGVKVGRYEGWKVGRWIRKTGERKAESGKGEKGGNYECKMQSAECKATEGFSRRHGGTEGGEKPRMKPEFELE